MACLQGDEKLSYEVWADRFLTAFHFLRDEGYSLTDLSLLVKKERGWADAARQYRSMVEESDLKTLEDEMAAVKKKSEPKAEETKTEEVKVEEHKMEALPEPSTNGTGGREPSLSRTEQIRAKDWMDELRKGGALWWQVDAVFGYQNVSGTTCYGAFKKNGRGISREAFLHASNEIDKFRKGKKKYLNTLVKPQREEKTNGKKKTTPPKPEEPFAWFHEIHDGLLKLAEKVERAAEKVPAGEFREPYNSRRDMLKDLAGMFTTDAPSDT